jgi:hypothetical protein
VTKVPSLDELWKSAPPAEQALGPGHLSGLPTAVQRYLEHAIAFETRLALSVRLQMHGEIKLKRWFPFTAEQVIRWDRGMIWRATVRMYGIPIRGFDRLIDGEGEMQWKVLGIIPLMTAAGSDITRSAAGRVHAETVWLPSVLCHEDVTWTAPESSRAHACFAVEGERAELELTIDDIGRLQSVKLRRWGNPDSTEYRYADFGGLVETEDTFDGYTIPTRLRVGWYFGTERFESEGEFFRCKIDHAEFR